MIKAVFTDFYGTLAHEDGEIVKRISEEIFDTGKADDISDIGAYWWERFQSLFSSSYGEDFRTQRELEYTSLEDTIKHFCSTADAGKLSELMFSHWQKPPVFADTLPFFEKCPVPVCIVSNIDRCDVMSALDHIGVKPRGIFTSEDARSYKPRKELFLYAMNKTGLAPHEVIHVGDSLSSDVKGAELAGIKAVWLNRGGREVPEGVNSVRVLTELFPFL
ncbi:HAD family hydrolase [Ruminococcus sp.]|uniref:HAD family hydrolase n=1 Tax=Ruminococcus sp. TaxID=41978 RepID=UPI0025E5AB79|nr:HAD family hydrolase [Ruminococcus sp.]MBR1432641.1 HAD family hydrolase [Ruminococcus sp.]